VHPTTRVTISPRYQLDAQYVDIENEQGFDSCVNGQPSEPQMAQMWNGTPFYVFYMYLGGSTAACSTPGTGWVNYALGLDWNLVPIWVGPQCCGTPNQADTVISTNTTTAYQQGVTEANNAFNAASNTGLGSQSVPIVYDFERDTDPPAEWSFLSGWDARLQQLNLVYGAYAATGGYEIQNWVANVAPVPTFVWPAWPNDVNSVWNINDLNNGYWVNYQRHHQYMNGHNVYPYNGVNLWIDTDCSDGPAWGPFSIWYTGNGSSCNGSPQ
jgi:hypothetical protein